MSNNTLKFETGATTMQANNLVLSVINDGNVYDERIHAAKRLLQGLDPIRSFREITVAEANKQRQQGFTFKPQHITEAAKIIQKESIQDAIELIHYKHEQEGKQNITVTCRRWFDKINGNSYFSLSINIANNVINIPMQYGYGSQWQYEAVNLLEKSGFIPAIPFYDNGDKNYGYMSAYSIDFNDEGYMQKHMMFGGLFF